MKRLREHRMSGSTRSKADRIIADLAKYPAHMQPRTRNGHFAAWISGRNGKFRRE